MTDSPTPTRAEADNVAAAIILGADYLMTSEETTAGKFPKETIEVIAKIIEYTENNTNVIPLEELNKIVKL
jgi:pyruvate kinase